jgi:hypothetical protein
MSWRPDETSSMTNTYDRVKFGNVPKSYPHPTRVIAYTRDDDYMPRTCLERRGLILLKKRRACSNVRGTAGKHSGNRKRASSSYMRVAV